ncbi:MAG: hypothetical protein KL840_13265 [Aquamicrobium sp.]|nr:hypothetical protein [Aquamicrobium sp.]
MGDLAWNMLLENDIKCRSIVECQLAYLMQKLVMAGVGIAVADPRTAAVHAAGGGIVRPLSAPIFCSISFIRRKDNFLTNIESEFVDNAIQYSESHTI